MSFTANDALYQLPLFILVITGLALVLAEAFARGKQHGFLMQIVVIGCVTAAFAAVMLAKHLGSGETIPLMSRMLQADQFAYYFIVLLCAATAMTALISPRHQEAFGWQMGEYYAILMLAVSGMAILAMAVDLVAIFIGIETMSLGVYVLTASRWRSRHGAEAAMKYFLTGAFATAILLYGIALVYGATGTTNLLLLDTAAAARQPHFLVGMFLLVAAFCFKVAAVPFHMWAPDAYEGAPTPVTGFMAAAVKTAAFAAILRIFCQTFGDSLPFAPLGWGGTLAVIAAITMTLGNIAALRQTNIKRMLAYSSISHAGVLLVGVVATGASSVVAGQPAVLYYLLAYVITTIGAFAAISWIGSREHERVLIEDYNGLASYSPAVALAMTICMLSLGGIPPTAGFVGKFYIFKTAIQAAGMDLMWLVVVGVLNSIVSIFYYLRVVTAMYFRDARGTFEPLRSRGTAFVIVACALGILAIGMLPGYWLELAGG